MTRGRKQCDPVNGCGKFYDQNLTECPSCKISDAFANFIPYNPLDWIYDEENFPNIFTCHLKHPNTGTRLLFEISDRRNDINELYQFLMSLKATGCRMIGFNNVGYDYPVLHFIIENYWSGLTITEIHNKSAQIIATPWENRYSNVIWDNDTHIIQIDLFKVHHFDNKSRRTSLKLLEFNMKMDSIEDLPFPPGTILNNTQKDVLISYGDHDVDATELFYFETLEMIEFREQLSEKYGRNFLNHNDKKIGTDLFIADIEEAAPGSCYMRNERNKRVPRQTIRDHVALRDVIFPYISFKVPEFQRVHNWLLDQVLTEKTISNELNLKGVFKGVSAQVNGFEYDFGSGGIHGSIPSTIVYSDDEYIIEDWDVAGYYPEVGSANKLFPEHLSTIFCDVNEKLKQERTKYKKGTPLNKSIKLSRNGAFGDSNSKYSPFYDPQYTLGITINGQLLLCMLAQHLIDVPGLEMIQVNTDGLTIRYPRIHKAAVHNICKWWEEFTQLELEDAIYSRMFIRDVNNYIAEYEGGDVKRKGAYEYKLEWHQDYSALVVPKAAEAALVHGQCIDDFIRNHTDINDFMLRTKVGKADNLMLSGSIELQRITRYYIANQGGPLAKVSPPAGDHKVGQWKRASGLTDAFYNAVLDELAHYDAGGCFDDLEPAELDTTGMPWDERINTKNHSIYDIRNTSINAGYLVAPCNKIKDAKRDNINFDFYIAEAEKLVKPLRGN